MVESLIIEGIIGLGLSHASREGCGIIASLSSISWGDGGRQNSFLGPLEGLVSAPVAKVLFVVPNKGKISQEVVWEPVVLQVERPRVVPPEEATPQGLMWGWRG